MKLNVHYFILGILLLMILKFTEIITFSWGWVLFPVLIFAIVLNLIFLIRAFLKLSNT